MLAIPRYTNQGTCTAEAGADDREPERRGAAVRGLVDGIGGRLDSLYYALGPADVITITEVPVGVSAAAIVLAAAGAGHLESHSSTVLTTVEEIIAAERKARDPAHPRLE